MPIDSINEVDDVEAPAGAPPGAPPGTGPAGTITAFLELAVTGPYVNISQGTAILEAGARQWVLCGVSLTGLTNGREADPSPYTVNMAIVQADPLAGDWQPAQWLTRSAAPDGDYAMIAAGDGETIDPAAGRWRVYVQVLAGGEILECLAPGYLIVH